MEQGKGFIRVAGAFMALHAAAASSHDPVFAPGPHVLYKEGVEIHVGLDRDEAGSDEETELGLELTYGLTGDWAAGLELPYVRIVEGGGHSSGAGDIGLFTKYRFRRHDSLGVQESSAVLLNVITDSGGDDSDPPTGTGTTDAVLGVTYGYESLEWFRWAGLRYRRNGENDARLRRGDRVSLDLTGGWRPEPPQYREPDTVWLLELNGEYARRAELNGVALPDTGGTEVFLSPGVFWTLRNFAVKAGVQVPVYDNLNGVQEETDYRMRVELEWHL